MSEPKKKDHWDELVSELGADSSQPTDSPRSEGASEPVETQEPSPIFESAEGAEPSEIAEPSENAEKVFQVSDDDILGESTSASLHSGEDLASEVHLSSGAIQPVTESVVDIPPLDSKGISSNTPSNVEATEGILEEQTSEKSKPKRRRRRRGRGRKSTDTENTEEDVDGTVEAIPDDNDNAEVSAADDDVGDTKHSAETRPKRRRRRRGRKSATSAEANHTASDESHDQDDFEELDRQPKLQDQTTKASHQNIPTWQEAIGVMIDSNMDARAKTPEKSSSRGRSRGRGKKKGAKKKSKF